MKERNQDERDDGGRDDDTIRRHVRMGEWNLIMVAECEDG